MGEGSSASLRALPGLLHPRQRSRRRSGHPFHRAPDVDSKVDAWGWLDREHRLIDRGDWTPPIERFREAAEERQRKEAVRQAAAAVPTISAYGSQYLERSDLAATSRDRYRQLLKFYILAEPATITRRGMVKGKPVAKRGLGDVRVTELTRADVRMWRQGLPVSTRESSSR